MLKKQIDVKETTGGPHAREYCKAYNYGNTTGLSPIKTMDELKLKILVYVLRNNHV